MSKTLPARVRWNQPCPGRIRSKVGRLIVDLPAESFQTAFTDFSRAAEDFAMTISSPWERKFAFQYLGYLQGIAHGSEQPRARTVSGRPACRLICLEMERLFRSHFFRPTEQNYRDLPKADLDGIHAA